MFYELIQHKRDKWLASPDCTVCPMLEYIGQRGMMRDAQIDAIKTYLFLKIACTDKPLYKLFTEGYFTETDIEAEELTKETRTVLETNKAALALFQYSRLKDKNGKQIAPELEKYIRHHASEIDYEHKFFRIFNEVSYADYLFSLPMGAGKTYLMAAFIYIDLYFAQNEPENPVWAHNFLILAPSALKSSILPSLRDIRDFDPSWIFSDLEAKKLQRLIQFEILDEQKSARKSNLIKNPNAQKINSHLMGGDAMGIVALTNAEKVILDKLDVDTESNLFSKEELKKIETANELRAIIGKIPHLAVFIDEVHHVTSSEIKLRKVVTKWATESMDFCNVLGFTGTPYLEKAEKINIGEGLDIKSSNISNVVYYYPLIDGIDNFLKRPKVKFTDEEGVAIIQHGVREFLDYYKDTTYADGTQAKLAIYCGKIYALEEIVYPVVSEIVTEYGLNPFEVILKRHKGDKQYPEPEGSEAEFANLSSSLSQVRIILLVQIGKEGWNCKSLTSVILPHKESCPKNMVLQTSCRCLRQVVKGKQESALIWMNKQNADKLNKELMQQQNITLKAFNNGPVKPLKHIERYSRRKADGISVISFHKFKVRYETKNVESQPDTEARLADPNILRKLDTSVITVQDLKDKSVRYEDLKLDYIDGQTFQWWVHEIARESFGTLSTGELMKYEQQLRNIYDQTRSNEYDHQYIRSMIRKAFVPKRDFTVIEEVVPDTAKILSVECPTPLHVADDILIYPDEKAVEEILDWDAHPDKGNMSPENLLIIEQVKATDLPEEAKEKIINGIKAQTPQDPHPERLQTYQYLPYRFDSNLEWHYFADELKNLMFRYENLEYYFNGDENMQSFKIQCYKKVGQHWQYDGNYVPDFLVLSRTSDGAIERVCIIETKGKGWADKFVSRKEFMEQVFIEKCNKDRFAFLYIDEDDIEKDRNKRIAKTISKIKEFFKKI